MGFATKKKGGICLLQTNQKMKQKAYLFINYWSAAAAGATGTNNGSGGGPSCTPCGGGDSGTTLALPISEPKFRIHIWSQLSTVVSVRK